MMKSAFHLLSTVALAASLVDIALPAQASGAHAEAEVDPNLQALLSLAGVSMSATGREASFSGGVLASGATPVLPGETTFHWLPDSGLRFSASGLGRVTFDTLVYDAVASMISADMHDVNGAVSPNHGPLAVFSVGPLSARLEAGRTDRRLLAHAPGRRRVWHDAFFMA